MKTSPAGKVLGPQSDQYEVVYDGPSMPMIKTPGGRLLCIQQFQNGKWTHGAMEPADTKFFVEAANLLREKNREERRLDEERAAAEADLT